MSGSSYLFWGMNNVPYSTPLQKLLVFELGDAMCADGICTLGTRDLAARCCSPEQEVWDQINAWQQAGHLATAFSDERQTVGWIFPVAYAEEQAAIRERDRKSRELRAAKKEAKAAKL